MKLAVFSSGLFLEIRQGSLKVLNGEEGLGLALDRQANGRLTPDCKEKVTAALQAFLKKKNWQRRWKAVCAIDARGVSMRRLNVPANSRQDLQSVLRLQIESEFPLPPEELAWGCIQNGQARAVETNGQRELTVVAVKKDILEEYAQMLAACGVNPVFTLAALARSWSFSGVSGSYAVLDIGRLNSELMTFENGAPAGLRILAWGGEQITRELEQRLSISHEEAEKLKLQWDEGPGGNGEIGRTVPSAIAAALDRLAEAINEYWSGGKLYLTGRSTNYKDLPKELSHRLPAGTSCQRIDSISGNYRSAAIAGLQHTSRTNGGEPPLIIRSKETKVGDLSGKTAGGALVSAWTARSREMLARPAMRRWARLTAVLAAAAICFPLVEPLVMKPYFTRRLAAVKADKSRLGIIDRELSFLQYLKQNQAPCLDVLTILSCSVGPGTRFDSIALNRRGDLALKASLKDSTQLSEFRSKLIKSGFFSNVTVEEQSPSPDRQKVSVRMTALVKPLAARAAVSMDTILSNAPPIVPGAGGFGGPEMMFPGGMPMPMPMPGGPMPGGPPVRPPGGATPLAPKAPEKGRTTRTIKIGDATVQVSPPSGSTPEPATPTP